MANNNLKSMIRELVRKELEEMTSSGAAGAYLTPNAFGSTNKKSATSLGMKLVNKEQEKDLKDDTTVTEDANKPALKWRDHQGDLIARTKLNKFVVCKEKGTSTYVLQVNDKVTAVGSIEDCKNAAEDIENRKIKEGAFPIITRHLAKLTEGKIVEYDDMTPRQKIYQLSREAKRSVNEIELLLDKMLAIKQEDSVNSDDYYKRTHKALQTMNEKIKHCILKMNSMK
jgi:hypothetical protein